MWALHRAHPTPGLPPGQTVLPHAPIGPAPMDAHAGRAARRAGSALYANLHSFVHAHDTPPADLASAGPAHAFVCVVNAESVHEDLDSAADRPVRRSVSVCV
eukprot:41859-Chlamydomonas_euryale.AAC.1